MSAPWLVLPVKSIADGKSRLADHLAPATRRAVNVELLARSLTLAARYPGLPRTVVVSHCADVLHLARARGAHCIEERGDGGLNAALDQALAALPGPADEHVLVLSCDVPFAREDDLRHMVVRARTSPCVVVATDRAGSGTNALCLPQGTSFQFRYGPASCLNHAAQASVLGLECVVLRHTSLAFDVDTVQDHREWRQREDLIQGHLVRSNCLS